ncbi:sensor domain-containing diguanylate cyclase [Undibacterium cyanobacteriorum]|uniref:Sensor domain-containing diguanylate cyclase n=1 Tax=Undibacterium cyanobacteriorum TaxID=3073561 RepID=A0ABY9RJ18_9BURK|nr:sensor domain-containing diguanylate cyclase [Undibacterium sp. 20NA77.5]WMW80337.1 sensor domain-containing diguanylate cyclase [Undibacterium sp. 20NA77.5]
MDTKSRAILVPAAQLDDELSKCANCFNLLEYLRYGVLYCIRPTESANDFLISYANRTFSKLTGITDLAEHWLSELQSHLQLLQHTLVDLANQVMESQRPYSEEFCSADGKHCFSINLSRLDIQAHSALIIALEDISERKQAELALRQMNQDFITVLESTSDFIYIKDQASRIRYCSQTLADITGHKSWRDMVGKHDKEIFPLETAQVYMQEEIPIFQKGIALLNKIDPYFRSDGSMGWVSTNKWPMFDEDGKTVIGIFGISRDISESKQREDELRTMATTDFLTGLASRRDFIDDVNRQIARIHRAPQIQTCLLMMDLDFFKRINDVYGHAVGDAMLQHISHLMKNEVRRVDSIGRIGGEEFAILMPDTTIAAAQAFADRIRNKVMHTPLLDKDRVIPITISIGITQISCNDRSSDSILERADTALYQAKNLGRNRVELA